MVCDSTRKKAERRGNSHQFIPGGPVLAFSFALLIVLSLVDMWFLPEEC
jgi:hypothetical protein